jgi:type II secretory pathway component PulF
MNNSPLDSYLGWLADLAGPALLFLVRLVVLFLTSGFAALLLAVIAGGVWAAISAALRREERARCFLRLLEIGLQQGRTVEETVSSLNSARVTEMGRHFSRFAGWMARGMRLGEATDEVPRFLPDQVNAMLRVGDVIEDVPRVLPICRASLTTGSSTARRQLDNVMALLFVSPAGPAVIAILSVFVLPKFRSLAEDMMPAPYAPMETWFSAAQFFAYVAAILWVVAWLLESGRGGGQWLLRLVRVGTTLTDWVQYQMPWKRRRMLRDFSALLGSLLDAGVPEARALDLAAEGAVNQRFRQRVSRARGRLAEGTPIGEAVADLDPTGEFAWRFRNASAAGSAANRFTAALQGWHESLDARAFRQEQIVSQSLTTLFVLLNGCMVGSAAIGVFSFLSHLVQSLAW